MTSYIPCSSPHCTSLQCLKDWNKFSDTISLLKYYFILLFTSLNFISWNYVIFTINPYRKSLIFLPLGSLLQSRMVLYRNISSLFPQSNIIDVCLDGLWLRIAAYRTATQRLVEWAIPYRTTSTYCGKPTAVFQGASKMTNEDFKSEFIQIIYGSTTFQIRFNCKDF